MVKSIKYIIKRIIIGVGIAIALMLIKGNLLIGVNAQTIQLGTPQTSGNYSGGNWPLVNAPINQSGYYSSYNISQHPTTGGVYFEWANANLCTGQNFTISGTAQVYRSGVANLGVVSIDGYFNGWSNKKSCTFSQNGNNVNFTCTGPGGGTFIIYYNYDNVVASNGSTLTINTPINVNIICEASNNDIIQNDVQNTQNIINNNNENTQSINNNLTDDTGVSNTDINNLFGELEESNTPISDLLLMPLTLLNAYLQGFNSTCQSVNIGRLFNTDLVFPCINIESYIGSSLWNVVDALISLFMIFNIGQLIITAFDGITSLNDDFQVLYGARHAAAPSSRVERNSDLY